MIRIHSKRIFKISIYFSICNILIFLKKTKIRFKCLPGVCVGGDFTHINRCKEPRSGLLCATCPVDYVIENLKIYNFFLIFFQKTQKTISSAGKNSNGCVKCDGINIFLMIFMIIMVIINNISISKLKNSLLKT